MFTRALTKTVLGINRSFSEVSLRDIQAGRLLVQKTQNHKQKPELDESLKFGAATTDHMLMIDWNDQTGWDAPKIQPYQNISLDPCSSVFHYGLECFEGLKAYKTPQGRICMFRPEMNMDRLQRSAIALALPEFDQGELLSCIKELIKLESEWIPQKKGFSLYIRPTMIGTHPVLGVTKSQSAKLFVVMTTVGPYFPTGFKPVNLYCDDTIVRAWPGGAGDKKIGGNYGPTIAHTNKINYLGYQQILWLISDLYTDNNVTEVGAMNFFVYWINKDGEKELVTCPLDSTILPGVTRDSVLALTKQWNEFKVTEKHFTIYEFIEAIEQGRVIEAFGAGTACIVCPVQKIHFKGKDYELPLELGNSGKLTKRLLDRIQSIQYGEENHTWTHYLS